MFKQFKQVFISFFTLSFAIFFIGCGGSGVSDPLNTSDFGQTPSPSISTVLNGSVIKGPVSGATVRAYRVVNGVKGQELGTAITAADGSYRLSVVGYDGPIVIEAFNGQYTDEATGIKKVLNRSMNSIVPKFTATKPAMVSPLTHMAAAIVSQSSDITETSIQDAIDEVSEFYSLSDILITTPSIITDSTVSVSEVESNQLNYGLILSAISQIGADENTDPLEIMDIIAQDASDGSFDGQNNGQTLTLNNKEVSQSFATKDIADSISTIVESLSSQVIVSVDPEFLFNLETTEGVIEKSSVKLSVKALPKLTGSNNIQLTGLATPGTSSIEIIQNDIKISEFFTGLDGTFSVQIGLIVNQLNQVTVRARNGGAVSERNIEIRQDSIPPSFSFLTTEPEYINSESVFLAYDLTDTYGGPADLTVSLSQGNALVNSNTIQLSNLVEGTHLLQLELFDQLNNRISQSYPLFVDFSAPILETTVPSLVNTNFNLALTHNENLSSLHYRFYSDQLNPPQFTPLQAGSLLNFDFQDVQGVHILEIQALDLSQNVSNYSTQIVFDSIPPYFLTTPVFASLINTTAINFNYAVGAGVAVTLIATAPDSSESTIILSGSPVAFPIDETQGIWHFNFTMLDQAQNSSSYSTSFTLDTLAPSPPVIIPSTTYTNSSQVNIGLSGENGSTLLIDGVSHGLLPSSTTLNLLSNSVNFFQFQLQDIAGNLSSSTSVSVTQDSSPPTGVRTVSVPNQEYLLSTNSIEFVFISNQIEPGATGVLNFLSEDYPLISTDQIRFSTSVNLAMMSTEVVNPDFSILMSDELFNSQVFSGSLTAQIDTILPQLSTPISFSTDPISDTTYIGQGSSILIDFELSKVEDSVEIYFDSNSVVTFSNVSTGQFRFRVNEYSQSDPNFLSFQLVASDAAGNSFTTHSVSPYISDTSPPVPTLLTNDAQGGGFLKIGDSITFILSMQSDEPHLEVSATYNSQDLQFDYILSSLGNYYQATYTVDELHPAYDGTVPPILLSSIKDRAGNEVTDLSPAAMDNVVQDVQSGFDNIIPSISSVSITTTVTKTLILSDSIEFLIVATDLGTNPSSPLSPIGTFNSETLSFTSTDGIHFYTTYIVAFSSINSDGPLTAEFRVGDGAGNLSATSSITVNHGVDSGFVEPSSLIGSINQTDHLLETGDIVTLTFTYDEDPELNRIEGEAFGVPLTFVASVGNNWTTDFAIPDTVIITDRIELIDTIFYEVSLNQSAEYSYVVTQLSMTVTPFITDVNIDTLKPLVGQITHNITTSYLAIGDSVSFTIFPTYGDLTALTTVPPVDISSLTLNIQYNEVSFIGNYMSTIGAYSATYTVDESHMSREAPIALTGVFFTDSEGRVGPVSSLSTLSSDPGYIDFIIDSSRPVIDSVTYSFSSSSSTLKVGDKITFLVSPTQSSTDAISLTGEFNSIPITFVTTNAGSSFIGTYTVVKGHTDQLDAFNFSQLKGLQLFDEAGNQGEFFDLSLAQSLLETEVWRDPYFGMEFKRITSGTFTMGSTLSSSGAAINETAEHQVTLTKDFYIGSYEVSQGQWEAVMGGADSWPASAPESPSSTYGYSSSHPAYFISWHDVTKVDGFLDKLNQASGCDTTSLSTDTARYSPLNVPAGCYRLPTEAEWEYAARGGTTTSFSFGVNTTGDYSWYDFNSNSQSQGVGQKLSNPYGLYDMHGNVAELVYDVYSPSYTTNSVIDPIGPSTSDSQRVTRGGGWSSQANDLRSAARNSIGTNIRANDIGLRLSRVPVDPSSILPGPFSVATNFEKFIDANLPDFNSIIVSPSNTVGSPTTIGIGASIVWELPFLNPVNLTNGDDLLSVTGNFLGTTVVFAFDGGSNLYRGSYTVSDFSTPSVLVSFDQIEVIVTDSAGNTLTTSTVNMGIGIDAERPQLDSISVTSENIAMTTIGILDRLRISAVVSPSSTLGGTDPIQNIAGSLNGESLIFTGPTTTAPFIWEAFYVVQENNDPSSSGTVFVSDVYAYDIVGNQSQEYTTSLSITIDTSRPVIDLVSISSVPTTDRLKVGEIIEFEVPSGSFASDIHSITGTFNSSSFEFVLTGTSASWKATYTIIEGYPDQTDPLNYPELVLDASDEAGNSLTNSFTTDVVRLFDANTPFISSLSHNATVAGTLYTHHAYATDDTSIEFTFTLTTPDSSLSVEAYYNQTAGGSIPLEFNSNSDGSQYVGTYYVRADHNSQATPINLTTLVVSDSFGNFTTGFTNDILKKIDTQAPSLINIVSTTNLIDNTVPNSSTYLKIGDQVQFVASFTSTALISSVTAEFNSQVLSFESSTPTTWIATYTVVEGHPSPTTSIPLINLRALDVNSRISAPGSTSVTRIVDATRPVLMSLIVTSTSAVPYLSNGDFINFEFAPQLQGSSVDSGGTVSATYNGVTLYWNEDPTDSGVYTSLYTASTNHADREVPLQLSNLMFYDAAGNVMMPPAATVEAMQGVTLGIDASIPDSPVVNPQYVTTDTSSYTLSIDAEVGTSLYINSIFHSEIPVSGTTSYVASLNANSVNTYSFYLIDFANKRSPTVTSQIFADSFARQKQLTSSFSGLKTTNIGISLIQESKHDSNRFFVYGRAGFGEIAFDSEIYTDRNQGLPNTKVNAIAEHPQMASSNILLLAKDNGLYRSSDSGLNWQEIDSNIFDSRVVNDVHFSGVNPTNVWVATDVNIFKSLDTGQSFSNFNVSGPADGSDTANRNSISLLFETDTSRLYAAMESGLFYSNSSGSNWSSILTNTANILKISQPTGQPETMFIISASQFLRSTSLSSDFASSLTTVTSDTLSDGDVNAIAFGPTAGVIYMASTSGIFESTDNGGSWYKSHQATGAGFPDSNYTAISAVSNNSNRILIGSNAALHKILNVTASPYTQNDLTSIFPAKISYVSSRYSDFSTVWALTEMWIYEYNVASDNWLLRSPATPISTYTFVEPHPIKDYLFVGSETTGISTMEYNGSESNLSLPITTSNTHVTSIAFHPSNADVVLVGTEYYGLFHTIDGGSNFANSSDGLGIVTVTAIAGDTSNVIVATTTGVARSSGSDWSNLSFVDSSCSVNSASQISIVSDSDGLYLVAQGDLHRAANDCSNIFNITPDFTPSVLTSLIITSSNALNHLIYIGTDQGLYRSQDGGTSFSAVDDTVKLNTHSLTLIENTNETHKILIGTDAGSYILSDIKLD